MFTGIALGLLIIIFIGFLAANLWLGKMIKDKRQELDEINLQVEQTPLEKQILRKVQFQESSGQENLLHHRQEQPKSQSLHLRGQSHRPELNQIKPQLQNPI